MQKNTTQDKKIGAVLVVGGGVGGIQSSLDLADSGYKVYLVEEKPAIGGVMAQLDKTFPTNDCSLCILSPKLVDIARHPNIELITNAELKDIKGKPGNFEVNINKKARFVSKDCVGCGLCATECVLSERLNNEFDEDIKKRSAIYIPYPQAVPLQYIVDKENCLYLSKGKCSQKCIEACPADAIDFSQKDKIIKFKVGAVILSPGYEKFDAKIKAEYGYGRYQNVVTSLEFERILSASGPFEGKILRPSDKKEPKKIAWIQCVGSRDQSCGNNYCSSVCCTYAIKESIIAKEHSNNISPTIFYMDMRTFGKGFEEYYNRANDEHGINFVRCRISEVQEDTKTDNLLIRYESEKGDLIEEEYDMVVLSVGLTPNNKIEDLSKKIGIKLNDFGFCKTNYFTPIETSKPGVYVCGAFAGPKDIPETVIQASGVAAKVSNLISSQRNKLVNKKKYPAEKDISKQDPRIGVFICHCGINIGAYVNVPEVVKYAKTLANVEYAEENLYTCSQDTQGSIVDKIKKYDLNRVVIASCTPRTHEPLFKETLREAGLNPYLFEMANIRDQCSWVHMKEPKKATNKAKDQLKMSVAKARLLEALPTINLDINKNALVIGGGIAGMNSALAIANQGYEVFLIEKEKELGGNAKNIFWTLDKNNIQTYLKKLINEIKNHKKIKVYKQAVIENIKGYIGNYETIIKNHSKLTLNHGVIVVATGAEEYKPGKYLYGKDKRVLTQNEFEQVLSREKDLNKKTIVMIQCVGSRDDIHPYCSRICCQEAIKNALKAKDMYPDSQVYLLYRDMRTYGFSEVFYEQAREKGIIFIRYKLDNKPVVKKEKNDIIIKVKDLILEEDLAINADYLVLSPAIIPRKENIDIAKMLKVPLNENGFFLEAHVKLRPVDFATEGVFVAGMAHSPKNIQESVSQAYAAAGRASIILSKDKISVEPAISVIDEEKCIGCGLCVSLCPYNAINLDLKEGGRKAVVISASCKGCGLCGASCPQHAISMKHFRNEELKAQIEAYGG